MSPEIIEERVCRVIAIYVKDSQRMSKLPKITRDSLLDDYGFDSVDMIALSMELEDSLFVDIPLDAMPEFNTVGDAIDYIKNAPVTAEVR